MDGLMLMKFAAAFVFVIALMYGMAYLIRRLGLAQNVALVPGRRRLKIVESLSLDARRRLVIVRRDGVEHLLVLGPQGECIVETGIAPPADNIVELPAQKDGTHV